MTDPASPPRTDPRPAPAVRGAAAIRVIARKELREMLRDGRFRVAGAAVLGLLLLSLALGYRQSRAMQAERAAAQAAADEHWREQDEKNPHVAAHYGTFVFKPAGALSFLDPGVEPFVGASLRIEAHKQNLLQGAPAQDGTAVQRFGRLSVAAVLQLLVPLVLIGLGFAAWTAERERGTLRQIGSLGVPTVALLGGKALGMSAALGLLLVPAGLAAALPLWIAGGAGEAPVTARFLTLLLVYLAYFGVYVAIALAVSARSSSSRVALVALLGFWVASGLVVPRVAADVAARAVALPSSSELGAAVRRSLEQGLPGGPPREERIAAITEGLLEREGFVGAETLMDPALLQGIELQAEAAFENEVFDHHFSRVADRIEAQERVVELASFVSPFVAIRSLSMALAGTDYAHHRDFAGAAERHRRALVDVLNRDFSRNAGSAGWSYKAGRELWSKAPALSYTRPQLGAVLARQAVPGCALAAWLVLSCAVAWAAAARMRVA
jgi:ABC-2 type transport system permease protein